MPRRKVKGTTDSRAFLQVRTICVEIINSANYAVISKKLDGTITGWNPAAVKLYQFSEKEALGSNISIIVPPERADENIAILAIILDDGRVDNLETVRMAKNGRRIDVSLDASPVRSPSGAIIGDSDITRDLTEQKLTERKFQQAFEACSSSMVMVDGLGHIVMVNAETARMFGYQREGLVGHSIEMLIPGPDCIGKRQDGTEFPVEVDLKSIRHDENFLGLYVIVDITERKRLDRLRDEFVATVSHELRTPLSSISASLSLLNNKSPDGLPEMVSRLIAIAHANCQRLVRLTNDILEIQKLESGQCLFNLGPVDIQSIVESTVDEMSGLAESRNVCLRIEAPFTTCKVQADPDRLVQVLSNLLSNAVKFSPLDSEVLVKIEERKSSVCITVNDRGPGVPTEFRSRIFEKFAQADGSNSRQTPGTGLGLSIVKQIVERLGGQVGFSDLPSGGSAFFVSLPLAEVCQSTPQRCGSNVVGLPSQLNVESNDVISCFAR